MEKCKSELRSPAKENSAKKYLTQNSIYHLEAPRVITVTGVTYLLLTSLKTEIDEQKRMKLTVQLELQQHKAKFGYNNNLKSEKELATQDPTISLISFDLQHVLPTPYLSTNVVVYKRQLSVYSLGVDEVATGKSFLHMWPETDRGRGSEDVAYTRAPLNAFSQ